MPMQQVFITLLTTYNKKLKTHF